jgi:ABC-type Fe3+ transport system substrate-binding protein
VPKNAPNPNAAKLFITYLHSPQGQTDMWELHQNDLHLYPESRQREGIQAVEKRFGITFADADIDWQDTNEAGNAAQREVVKIFQASGK